jgi:N-methylhydantoinase A
MSRWRVGVDSGGTFTDVFLFDEEDGRIEVWKVPSTPEDPSRGIAQGVEEAMRRALPGQDELPCASVVYFGHGTTVATNALIQHRGVRTGLITTEGFRDLLEIGRQKRPDLYDLQADKPPTLVPRDLRLEVPERVLHSGEVATPLDEQAVRAAARRLRSAGVEAVAVSFLYGFVRPDHERRALAILREELPDAFLSAGHEIAPEFREFERLSTVVLNAYLGPVMAGYIDRLSPRLAALGMAATPHLTQSNGGVIGFATAAAMPVRTVLSAPRPESSARRRSAARPDCRTSSPSTWAGPRPTWPLLQNGQCSLASRRRCTAIRSRRRCSTSIPSARRRLDRLHRCRRPVEGRPTLVRRRPGSGLLWPGQPGARRHRRQRGAADAQSRAPAGGRMPIRRALAVEAIQRLADRLGLGLMATAQGIVSVVTANMARAIRVISVQRGHDPRHYTLMAFGGAGPLHAARLARELDMRRVLVPAKPGILCAMGLLMTDLRADFAVTRLLPVGNAGDDRPGRGLRGARRTRRAVVRAGGHRRRQPPAHPHRRHALPWPELRARHRPARRRDRPGEPGRQLAAALCRGATGSATVSPPTTIRRDRHPPLEANGVVRKAELATQPEAGPDATGAIVRRRDVWLPETGGEAATPIYSRELLRPGNRFTGTGHRRADGRHTLVAAGMTARVERLAQPDLEAS